MGERLAITPDDVAALAAQGVDASQVSNVQFFANAFETYTQGIDIVATYPLRLSGGRFGRTVWTFAGNWNDTKINLDSIDPHVIGSLRKHQLEELEPEFRFSLTADHTWGPCRNLFDPEQIRPRLRPEIPEHLAVRFRRRFLLRPRRLRVGITGERRGDACVAPTPTSAPTSSSDSDFSGSVGYQFEFER